MPPKTRSSTLIERDPLKALTGRVKGSGKHNTRSVSKRKQIVSNVVREVVRETNEGMSPEELEALQKKAIKKAIKDMEKRDRQAKPPKKCGARKIANKDRMDFEPAFRKRFWRKHANSPCAKCGDPIAEDERSIDHVTPWADVRIGLETATVCKDDVHWEVVFVDTMLTAYQDKRNLVPMHKRCNSSKGGTQGNDTITPIKVGVCFGNCSLEKAT
ncbi:HNH endonuclease [Limibaculum sp. FT325]|uniref:HNH endonuclease n=1 Tax=Thermohalobaculum sediminis TaxID=2939436 RepID=UPI0020BE69FB|nr:HNH endonuclease signature motif containing protein [Limibaculum sediminis]MCL5778124.1 HNH endonuclease [Limibaculum sediminis]